jgi:hypothetical protein
MLVILRKNANCQAGATHVGDHSPSLQSLPATPPCQCHLNNVTLTTPLNATTAALIHQQQCQSGVGIAPPLTPRRRQVAGEVL